MFFLNEDVWISIKFPWNLFLRVQLTIFQHWFRWWLGGDQSTSHYLNQWWPRLPTHICITWPQWVKQQCSLANGWCRFIPNSCKCSNCDCCNKISDKIWIQFCAYLVIVMLLFLSMNSWSGLHNNDDAWVGAMAWQIIGNWSVCSAACSEWQQRKYQVTSRFPSQRVSNMESISMSWHHGVNYWTIESYK